jgi:hypothetical protein
VDKIMVNINKEEVGILNRLWRECREIAVKNLNFKKK